MSGDIDFAGLIGPVARALLGEPNKRLSHEKRGELRWGNHGSLVVELGKGTWFDHEHGVGGGVLDLILRQVGGCSTRADAYRWVCEHSFAAAQPSGAEAGHDGHGSRVAAVYPYVDEEGELLYEVVRLEPKRFYQRRTAREGDPPDKVRDGRYAGQGALDDVRRVPYRLPQVLEAIALGQTVFVCEGEKDCDNLWSLNCPATTNAGGAGKWANELTGHFRGADVIVLPDNDPTGRRHAETVAAALAPIAAKVRVLAIPRLSQKQDVSDFIVAGGTAEDLHDLLRSRHATTWPLLPWSVDGGSQDETRSESEAEPSRLDPEVVITLLAGLPPIEYDRRRKAEAEALGVRVETLDRLVAARRAGGTAAGGEGGRRVELADPEPWPEPVGGVELIDEIVRILRRHVILPTGAAEAAALWTMHAHCHDAAGISPILAITSPTPECGKTTLLDVVGGLVPRRIDAANITAAALFRTVEKWRPSLLIDEADTFLAENDGLRGILNSGHRKATAWVIRTVGDDRDPVQFRTWAPKVVATIGRLHPTLVSRSIVIELRRMGAGERVEPLSPEQGLALSADACRKSWRWAQDHLALLRAAKPAIPASLRARLADNWAPLLAIADALGGDWPARARLAAETLSAGRSDETASVVLLEDLKAMFAERGVDRLTSIEIVSALGKLEDRPWPEWKKGKAITPRQLASLLEPFKVRPKSLWFGDRKDKGYVLADFAETFLRYGSAFAP
jgi:putative DNA primase/helicase